MTPENRKIFDSLPRSLRKMRSVRILLERDYPGEPLEEVLDRLAAKGSLR